MTDLYMELDEIAEHIRKYDVAFELHESDHVWPKSSTSQLCRCPKHCHGTQSLWYVCYRRIMDAKQGVPLRPARELAAQLKASVK